MLISSTSRMTGLRAIVHFIQARFSAWLKFLGSMTLFPASRLDDLAAVLPSVQAARDYLGTRQIALQQITGSVDRCQDFDRNFRPLKFHLYNRWINCYLLGKYGKLPAIRLFQVGEQYYVGDGHHRLSVAHALGLPSIQAEVWQYQPAIT